MGTLKPIQIQKNPDLYEWDPGIDDLFYRYDGENVIADYDGKVGHLVGSIEDISTLPTFFIKKNHYKARMGEIVQHMNYFTKFYDLDRDTFFSMMSLKYLIDTNLDLKQPDFVVMIMDRIVTPAFIAKCKRMAFDLYKLNINADTTGKFNNTPKITNAQAFQIVAVSFSFKILTPIILHFSNINRNFNPMIKTEYLRWFDKIFNRVIKKFEINDVPFYNSLCKFIVFRGDKLFRNNPTAFYQKKMLRGDTIDLFNQVLIREVVCVKTLYKLDYRGSCVAFIDGVLHNFNSNYLKEKFISKPSEIDSDDSSRDSDESLSHAEALEMQTYKRDESAAMITDINTAYVMKMLREWYSALHVPEEEFQFYYKNFKPSEISEYLFNNFYASKFKDPFATANLNRPDTVYLIICMKKILQRYKMPYLAQICTAQIFGKFKKNMIKDSKSTEAFLESEMYREVISKKFANLMELPMKENPILQMRINIINSTYILLDTDEVLNGYHLEHFDITRVSNEYLAFLSMI